MIVQSFRHRGRVVYCDGLLIHFLKGARVRISSVSFFLCRYGGVVDRARLEI